MKRMDYLGIVPQQSVGKEIEALAMTEMTDDAEARSFYQIVKERLKKVNQWHTIAGILSAEFQLTDADGNVINGEPRVGYLLKIDIPGPGSKEGEGFDWVHIEDVRSINESERQGYGFRVRPTSNPTGDKNETAHFYGDGSTSTFMVLRENSIVTAWIVDRNIKPNTEPVSVIDKIRDSVVGMSALIQFSKLQWQSLADGLLKLQE